MLSKGSSYRWLGIALLMLAVSACAKEDVPSSIRDFFRQPVVERMRTFRARPLDMQLALFFYGNQKIHPPALYLADCFALNGAAGAALLRERLGVAGSDLDTRDIAALLDAIQTMGTHDVRHDSLLMDRLNGRIASMSDPGWKDAASSLLQRIETVPTQPPGDMTRCENRR